MDKQSDLPDTDYTTSDLGEASYIGTKYPALDIRPAPSSPHRLEFVFDPGAASMGKDYYRGATVEAQRLLMVFRELKGRLFRTLRQR